MEIPNSHAGLFMQTLCQQTGADCKAQVSMFDIGAAIGLEKEAARKLAEELIAQGLVEIKTLSGGIGITPQGLEMTQATGHAGLAEDLNIGQGPLLKEKGRKVLETILESVKSCITASNQPYDQLEEMVIDIKTLEVQLLSQKPKIAVIKALLHALREGLPDDATDLADRLERMIKNR